jgi:pseudouridine-5'-phosphate glycosidase
VTGSQLGTVDEMIVVSEEVGDALRDARPVLAMESTIFTHGLPRPRNLEVALAAEERARGLGVVPATIGVVSGVPHVGLVAAQIEELANSDDVHKASVRDLGPVGVAGSHAGTTVAATATLAQLAGVATFSTGGLGGVHRGAPDTYDESADLTTLATTPIVVVSAGVKSILDIGLTLERFETLNLPVVGYRTDRFPGFYVADSGYPLDHRVDDAAEIVSIRERMDALGLTAALLVANPIPAAEQLDPGSHDAALAEALAAAEANGVTGKATTPFLLDHIQRVTAGRSLDVNVAVYLNNVALGCAIAVEVAARRRTRRPA